MASNSFEEVVSMLLQIKHSLQRGIPMSTSELLGKIDSCISKVIPFVNVYANNNRKIPQDPILQSCRHKSTIIERPPSELSFDSAAYSQIRKSADEELLKVRNSFIRRQSSSMQLSLLEEKELEKNSILLDYFVLKYSLSLNEYMVFGRKGHSKTDRKVFTDLLTFDNKRIHVSRLHKTESMTNVLKQIFSQTKPTEPFILPNYQEKETKYLFVFGFSECASIADQYYRTETMCCFVSNEFIVGDLMQLMNQISKMCFEQQVYEASHAQDHYLAQTISTLHGKKSYEKMQKVIEDYLKKKSDSLSNSRLFSSKSSQTYPTSIETYLQRSTLLISSVKRGKDHRTFITLILLYCLTLSEYKIVILSKCDKKNLFSELTLGLIKSLEPLTYIYPIVGTTITAHHFEFANSPVPIIVGFWGTEPDYQAAKNSLKKMLKAQKNMSQEELSSETLLAVVDLQDNSLHFLENSFKEVCYLCEKIQNFTESETNQLISTKLSRLSKMLVQGYRAEDWMLQLAKNLKVTQMYDYFVAKK